MKKHILIPLAFLLSAGLLGLGITPMATHLPTDQVDLSRNPKSGHGRKSKNGESA